MLTVVSLTVPAPTACEWCRAKGCLACRWLGIGEVAFDLGATRTFRGGRKAEYAPQSATSGRLTLTCRRVQGGKPTVARYTVREFACDFAGRAFSIAKVATTRKHEVFLGHDGSCSCSCEGETFQSAAKANQDAWDRGEQTFATGGCVHVDGLRLLLQGGFFSLKGEA